MVARYINDSPTNKEKTPYKVLSPFSLSIMNDWNCNS